MRASAETSAGLVKLVAIMQRSSFERRQKREGLLLFLLGSPSREVMTPGEDIGETTEWLLRWCSICGKVRVVFLALFKILKLGAQSKGSR